MSTKLTQKWSVFSWVIREAWKADKNLVTLSVGSGTLSGMLVIPKIYIDKLLIDFTILAIGKPNWSSSLKYITLLITLRFILEAITSYIKSLSDHWDWALGRKFSNHIDVLVAKQYSLVDVSLAEGPEFKDKFNQITRTGSAKAFNLIQTVSQIPEDISGMVSSLSIFLFFQPLVALILIGLSIPKLISDSYFIKRRYQMEKIFNPLWRLRNQIANYLTTSKTYLELRIHQITQYLGDKLFSVSENLFVINNKEMLSQLNSRYLFLIPPNLFSASLAVYYTYLVIIGKLTLGSSQAYLRATSNFENYFRSFARHTLDFYENYLYVSDLTWFLNLSRPVNLNKGSTFPKEIKQGIEFKNVKFKYSGSDNLVINGLTFDILPKQNIAIVGLNGAGKTTLVKLLAGFYAPTQGQILIDKRKILDYKQSEYWTNLAILFQDVEGYSLTAKESIGYGNISEVDNLEKIRNAAKLADIDDWIMSLPLKYENPLTRDFEKGVIPSGGQWQRIGIARTLIKDAQIIILDEPTSSVDPEAEEEIFNKLLKLGKDKILIFISHRFSTVRLADKILVMDKGMLIEEGNHEKLMKLDGKYAHLFNLQAKSYQ